jgi:proline iminopeptidase
MPHLVRSWASLWHTPRPVDGRDGILRAVSAETVAMPDGAVLRLTTTGSGYPLVLCHGGPGLWDYLAPLAGLVEDMALVHRYDQRGCGQSTGDGPFTVAQFVADLEALRLALGHETWWVGGHSWGAELALRYALDHSGHVRGVVYVCGTGIGDGFRDAYRAEMRRRLAGDFPRWQYPRDKRDRTDAEEGEFCLLQWRPDHAPGPDAARLAASMWDPRRRVNLRCNRELAADRSHNEPQLARRCAQLGRPVLILHGAEDPRPVWATDSLMQALPNARRSAIKDAGHLPWLEQPRTVAEQIRGFMTQHEASRQ